MKQKNFLKITLLLFFFLIGFSSFSQSVVINEVVTDPQQDWSTNGFDGTVGASSITATDEWIELFIKTAGLDLTGWTIEFHDSASSSGDLTSTGAFDVSNYITSGAGTFTNTEVGDFLVLGNPDGSTAMNNDVTITLRDSGNTIIDIVVIGDGSDIHVGGVTTLDGNASNLGDQSFQRIPNGTDTDNDNSDFSKGVSSLGAINPTQVSWDGSTSNDWSTASNWAHASVPSGTDNVFIASGLTRYPTTSGAVTVNSITIESGATLISANTFTGNTTYNRTLDNGSQWYYMSSPVVGEAYNDAWAIANSLASGENNNKGLSWYDNTSYDTDSGAGDTETGYWRYLQSDDSNTGTFNVGQGFGVITTASSTVSFIGTGIYTVSQTRAITTDVSNFNLVGNPFTSYLNLGDFFADNGASIITGASAYFWNGSSYDTRTLGLNPTYEIAPGQGFFVEAADDINLTFDIADISHQGTETFQKKSRPEINLFLSDGNNNRYANIYYIDGTTTGYDVGYDGKLFGGITQSFALFSHLVSDSTGDKYQLQSLPDSDYENMVIPIGVNAAAGKEITFTAQTLNLPNDLKVFFEDRVTNTFTRLDEANSNYKITLTEKVEDIGRFYLHTKSNVLNTDNINLENISIYKLNNENIRIVGLEQEKVGVKLFNILGKQVMNSSFTSNGVKDINLPKLATGIYVVQLETGNGKLNKKIIIE